MSKYFSKTMNDLKQKIINRYQNKFIKQIYLENQYVNLKLWKHIWCVCALIP